MTTNAIPASQFVNVIPSVLGTGGNPLALNSVWLDEDSSIPIGTVQGFGNLTAVENWYGPASNQAALAAVYFSGFIGCQQLPNVLYFVQYAAAAVAAWLRGGSMAGVTLTQLQALSGTLIITIDGTPYTTSSINLSAATSFSEAATTIIQAAFTTLTAPVTVTYDALRQGFLFTSTVTGASSTMGFATGTLAAGLNLTQALGAITSQGAIASVPATIMTQIVGITQNWATFMTTFQPNLSVMEAFAAWVNAQDQQFAYVNWDSNIVATETPPQAGVFAQIVLDYNGCISVYDSTGMYAAFICGMTASIDFSETNGYITYGFKGNALLTPNVTNITTYLNLIANGYNAYCSIATANQNFQQLQNGQISGDWDWIDEYIAQIYLNSQLQLALMELLASVKSLPYNVQGYNLIFAACLAPINQAINFGTIQSGTTLSPAQIAEVNQAAGANIANALVAQGYYLQILPATAQQRGTRSSPPCTLWYCSGGSIQQINLASIAVQ